MTERTLTPRANFSGRVYDMVGKDGVVYFDGEWLTDRYAAWRGLHAPGVTPDEKGVYKPTAKGLKKADASVHGEVPNIAGLIESLTKDGNEVALRWAGTAYVVRSARLSERYVGLDLTETAPVLAEDPEPVNVLDVWVPVDTIDPRRLTPEQLTFTAVAYRPLIMRDSKYSHRASFSDGNPRHPVLVRDHKDELTAAVMPVRPPSGDQVLHVTWGDPEEMES